MMFFSFFDLLIFSSGAFGYFEVTDDITKYCKADFLSEVGKRTPVAARFSTVGESGGVGG